MQGGKNRHFPVALPYLSCYCRTSFVIGHWSFRFAVICHPWRHLFGFASRHWSLCASRRHLPSLVSSVIGHSTPFTTIRLCPYVLMSLYLFLLPYTPIPLYPYTLIPYTLMPLCPYASFPLSPHSSCLLPPEKPLLNKIPYVIHPGIQIVH